MSAGAYLNNHLLVAMPSLADPNFSHSVTLVCEHNERGALGLVINRPLDMRMSEVLDQLSLETEDARLRDMPVLAGGPVQRDRGFVLHRPGGQAQRLGHVVVAGLAVAEELRGDLAVGAAFGDPSGRSSRQGCGWQLSSTRQRARAAVEDGGPR